MKGAGLHLNVQLGSSYFQTLHSLDALKDPKHGAKPKRPCWYIDRFQGPQAMKPKPYLYSLEVEALKLRPVHKEAE